ncbi:hypothetical protein QWZ14_29515, partial [Paeniroseomonas aquatica]
MPSRAFDRPALPVSNIRDADLDQTTSNHPFAFFYLYFMGIVFGFFIYLSGFFVKSLWGITILFYLGLAMLPVTEVVLALFLALGLHWAHRRRRLLWFGRANILVVVLMRSCTRLNALLRLG